MLSTDFQAEMGALIRSLANRIVVEPELRAVDADLVLDEIDRAIIRLVGLRLSLQVKR